MARRNWISLGTIGAALGAALVAAGAMAACATTTSSSSKLDAAATLARGGRLYDNWMVETGALADPVAAHPAYPADGAYASTPATTWRCKECHGWDYLGADGAYASGEHRTGIAGIAAMSGRTAAEVDAVLRASSHGYADVLGDADLRALALFVAEGQITMDTVIDRETGEAAGDATRGAAHFANLCAGCHGADGNAAEMPTLGPVARGNPWETLHKILNGQPGTAMPALRSLDRNVALDILRHAQTLPE